MIVFNRSRKKRNQEATVAAFNIKICIQAEQGWKTNINMRLVLAWALLIKIESYGFSLLYFKINRFVQLDFQILFI